MDILVSIEDPQQAWRFIESLRSVSPSPQIRILPEQPDVEIEPPVKTKRSAFVNRHNGAIPDLDVAAFENYVAQTRNEYGDKRENAHFLLGKPFTETEFDQLIEQAENSRKYSYEEAKAFLG